MSPGPERLRRSHHVIAELESAKSRAERFVDQTEARTHQHIQEQIEYKVAHYARHPDDIDGRLRQLDNEWDVSRRLQANASGMIIGSLVLGRFFRILRPLPYIASAFLLMHAIRGWAPPVLGLRRFGVRTRDEIEQERRALKALRGDFGEIPPNANIDEKVERALQAAGWAE
jgi:hypothetical protein